MLHKVDMVDIGLQPLTIIQIVAGSNPPQLLSSI